MNERERVLAVLHRQRPDRVPWVAKLELWYNARIATGTLPERFKGRSLWDIDRELGIGIRAWTDLVTLQNDGFEKIVGREGEETRTAYVTPIGTVTTREVYNETMRLAGVTTGYQYDHMIKRVEDYDIAEYIFAHTKPIECYEKFSRLRDRIGTDGFVMGGKLECPFQSWLIRLTGYETGLLHLHDHTARVEEFLRFLTDWTREYYRIMLDSPAELLLSVDHFDGTITHPKLFRQYCLPIMQELTGAAHQHGKWVASHFDGEPMPLLNVFAESGVDVAECFTPAPLTRAPLAEAQSAWGSRVIIWGGIPSTLLGPATSEGEFECFLDTLFLQAVPRGNLILGVADNITADAILDRVIRISSLVKQQGQKHGNSAKDS
jgi:hypothetical protein